jgi:RNA polymerase sigma factor (TIGR02999 family)
MAELVTPMVTELLAKARGGDTESLRQLLVVVYPELRRIAHYHLRGERPNHTLQSTALVNEVYVRILKNNPDLRNRAYFFCACSQLMRQILVDYARSRRAAKRDAGFVLTLEQGTAYADVKTVDLIMLDDALTKLAKLDSRQSRIVELRFFGGLSIDETAQVLNTSTATIKREWITARLWLHKRVRGAGT